MSVAKSRLGITITIGIRSPIPSRTILSKWVFSTMTQIHDAITSEDISTIFADIVSSISINTPQVPTKVEGNDPVHDGYITYTDYIGDYMEVDSVKELIWAGKELKNPQVTGEGTDDVTYTFSGGDFNNPAYENAQNANQIQITVHTETAQDGTKSQTMTVRIPATAIPLRVNTIELGEDDQGRTIVESNNSKRQRLSVASRVWRKSAGGY